MASLFLVDLGKNILKIMAPRFLVVKEKSIFRIQ